MFENRELLKALLYKFSPESMLLKEKILSSFIISILYERDGLPDNKIHSIIHEEPLNSKIPVDYLQNALSQLVLDGRLVKDQSNNYFLSSSAREREKNSRYHNSQTIDRIVLEFDLDDKSKEAFFEGLYELFAKIGGESYEILSGAQNSNGSEQEIKSVSKNISDKHNISESWLNTKLMEVIESRSPEATELKWRIAQGYFSVKLISSPLAVDLLNDERFDKSTFYLDTNILVPAIKRESKLGAAYSSFNKLASERDIYLFCTDFTLLELRGMIDSAHTESINILKQRDGYDILVSANSFFQSDIIDIVAEKGTITEDDINNLAEKYKDIEETIKNLGIVVENTSMRLLPGDSDKIETLKHKIKYKSIEKRNKHKTDAQALHDARLLNWVHTQRKSDDKVYILTADITLPDIKIIDDEQSFCITIDALVQWISALVETSNTNYSEVFAESTRLRLLPSDKILYLQDYAIFRKIDYNINALPIDDVNKMVVQVKRLGVNINLGSAEGRERVLGVINRYIADPSTTFAKKTKEFEKKLHEAEVSSSTKSRQIQSLNKAIEDADKTSRDKDKAIESNRRLIICLSIILVSVLIGALTDEIFSALMLGFAVVGAYLAFKNSISH